MSRNGVVLHRYEYGKSGELVEHGRGERFRLEYEYDDRGQPTVIRLRPASSSEGGDARGPK